MYLYVYECFCPDKMSSVKYCRLCEKLLEREMIGHNFTTLGKETPPKSWCCRLEFYSGHPPKYSPLIVRPGCRVSPLPLLSTPLCSASPLPAQRGAHPTNWGETGIGERGGADTQHSLDIISCLRGQVRSCNIRLTSESRCLSRVIYGS